MRSFYIRDLDVIVELMDIMIDRNYSRVNDIFDCFLDICAKVKVSTALKHVLCD